MMRTKGWQLFVFFAGVLGFCAGCAGVPTTPGAGATRPAGAASTEDDDEGWLFNKLDRSRIFGDDAERALGRGAGFGHRADHFAGADRQRGAAGRRFRFRIRVVGPFAVEALRRSEESRRLWARRRQGPSIPQGGRGTVPTEEICGGGRQVQVGRQTLARLAPGRRRPVHGGRKPVLRRPVSQGAGLLRQPVEEVRQLPAYRHGGQAGVFHRAILGTACTENTRTGRSRPT